MAQARPVQVEVYLAQVGGHITLASYADRWFATAQLSERTGQNYRSTLNNHVLPQFGSRGLTVTRSPVRMCGLSCRNLGAPITP